jgi:hypothetical protein
MSDILYAAGLGDSYIKVSTLGHVLAGAVGIVAVGVVVVGVFSARAVARHLSMNRKHLRESGASEETGFHPEHL